LIPDSDVTLEPHPDSNRGATNEYTLAKLVANRLRLAGRPIERKVVESMELDYGGNGGRLLSSEAVAEIQQRAAPGFAELLNRYGQDPDLVSRWAACPRDDVFFDPSVRASVVGQLEVAREAAAAAAKRRKDKRVEAKAKAKATKRALENARARLKNTTAKLTELEGQLNKTQIRLAKAQTKKQALESRLDEMQDRLQQATDQRDYLRRRLDLLKVWRARNWPEYAVILKRRLKRRLGGR
jgi:DNA repair exonuclease SbcCD ATPase subunit